MKHSSKKLRFFLVTVCILFIAITAYFTMMFYHIKQVTHRTFTVQSHISSKVMSKRPISILIMGTDVGALNRGNTGGNTDTLELVTANPSKRTITLTSIPRDTLVKMNSPKASAKYAKINSAYQVGGAHQTVNQVKELLNVPIDYYAVVNMGVLKKIVDCVHGVNVNNPFAFTYEGHYFKQGKQHLNGELALKYSRMRYDDPNNDYGRQKRQQQIIISIIDQFKHHASVKAVNSIVKAVGDGVITNVPINDIEPLYDNYHAAMKTIRTDHLQGEDANVNNISYQIINVKELRRVSGNLRKSLDLPQEKLINNETDLYQEKDDLTDLMNN